MYPSENIKGTNELPRRKQRPKAARGRKELKSWTPQAFNFKSIQ
jgi:hypothetical protein